jgi:CHAT domain-containing protein
MMQNHFVEALMSLLKEYDSLSAKERYAFEYEPINRSLDRLIPIYELPNKDFAELYSVRYGSNHISSKRSQYLKDCVEKLQDYTSFFTYTLNFKYAILCVKAQQRIASLCKELETETLWMTYVTGIALYARLYDYKKLFEFCDEGLKVARENDDVPLEFIILVRKWVQCYLATLQDNSLDVDIVQLDTEEQLLRLYAPYGNNVDNFVESLKDKEMRILEEVGPSGFSTYKIHIGLLDESLTSYKMMLAQGREDSQAVEYSLNIVREVEKETFGEESDSDHRQNLTLIGNLQGELSPEQAQVVYRGALETATPEQVIPEGTEPMERFFKSVFFSRHLIENKHKENAIKFYDAARDLVEGLGDPFLAAMVLLTKARITQEDNLEQAIKEKEEALALLDTAEASGCKFAMVDYLRYTIHTEMGDLFLEKQPQKSVEEFTKAINSLKTISLGQTLRISQLLNYRGLAHFYTKEREAEEKDYIQSFSVVIEDVRSRLPFMNSEKREKYWENVSVALQQTMLMIDEDSSPELMKLAYQVVLLSKGLLLSSEQTVKNVIESDESLEELRPIYKKLEETAMYSKPADINQEDVVNNYTSQYIQKVRLTQALNQVIAKHCDYLYETFEIVQKRLGKNQILVDYFDYELDDGDQQYVAFVVTCDNPTPILIKLCKESDLSRIFIDAKVDSTLDEVYNPRKNYSFELTKVLWKPIEEIAHVSFSSEVFIVPSGSLAKIPIESLPIVEGKDTVLSEYFMGFARLSHARALSLQNDKSINSIALFGGLDYGQGSIDSNDTPQSRGYSVGVLSDSPTPLEAWQFLKGTQKEVNTIANWLRIAHKDVQVFEGEIGTVTSFKSLASKTPDIIHIATHGFFETKNTAVNLPALQSDNPMSMSGLVFANGNEGWLHGTPQSHEGIITAAEISQMKLPSKIVVLSACHSGEGMLRADGVYGLQRGFKKAGVQCLIMSLWVMEDSAMQTFMEMFYAKLIGGKDCHAAFFDTKHELMKATPNMPWMWAGLIMLD